MLPTLITLLASSALASEAQPTTIVGSSTIAPYAELVLKYLGSDHKVEITPTGSNAGFEALCSADPVGRPSVAMASRQFSGGDVSACSSAVEGTVEEIELGANGVAVISYRGGELGGVNLSFRDLFLAVAAEVPTSDENCELISNPYTTWSDIRSDLPATAIVVYGPGPQSGTRSVFEKSALERGGRDIACLAQVESDVPGTIKALSRSLRTDDTWIEAGENDVEVVADLHTHPTAIGILGYASTTRFKRHIELISVDGVEPSPESLATGSYALSSKLYLYVNKNQLAEDSSAQAFVGLFTSDEAMGTNGFLVRRGLIPLR